MQWRRAPGVPSWRSGAGRSVLHTLHTLHTLHALHVGRDHGAASGAGATLQIMERAVRRKSGRSEAARDEQVKPIEYAEPRYLIGERIPAPGGKGVTICRIFCGVLPHLSALCRAFLTTDGRMGTDRFAMRKIRAVEGGGAMSGTDFCDGCSLTTRLAKRRGAGTAGGRQAGVEASRL